MPSFYEKVVSVIGKSEDKRTDFECTELIGWFRNKSSLFQTLKSDIVKDVIRHCIFERKLKDDVIIKQGESGDRLYIILKGQVSIYVVNDLENESDIRQHVEKVCSKSKLDRSQLGQHVWTSGDGHTVGEIALIKEDCIRTATVVVDSDSDLMVVDRALYTRSVKDVLEREFQEKTDFVASNSLFQHWSPRQKKSMTISLKKECFQYGSVLTRQSHNVDNIYFIRNGEAEVVIDQGAHKTQYSELWSEMERLLPELLPPNYDMNCTPYESLRRKRGAHRLFQMCLLGANEIVGVLELVLGLPSYLESCTVTRTSDILVLSKANYLRLFNRRASAKSLEMLRDMLCTRLYLYIHRSQLSDNYAPFLKYLTIKLRDTDSLKLLKYKTKKRVDYSERGYLYYGFYEYTRLEKHDVGLVKLMKILDIHYMGLDNCLPELETSTRVLTDLENRMDDWVMRSKGQREDPKRPKTAQNGQRKPKRYIVEALNAPPKLATFLERCKTSL